MNYIIHYDHDSPDFVCESKPAFDDRRTVDSALKTLLQNKEVFASAVNYALYKGEEVVKSESLTEQNPEKIYEEIKEPNIRITVSKRRDILMESVIKEDESAEYMVIGVENQLHIDYSMFARAMLYDSLDYLSKNRREHKGVVTIVIYYGKKPWTAPRSVHEYLRRGGMSEEKIKKFPNYFYYLISLSELTKKNQKLIGNELGTISSFLRLEKEHREVEDFIESKEYNELSTEGQNAIMAIEGDNGMERDPIRKYGDMREEKGIELGKQEGVVSGVAKSLISLMKRMNLTEKQAMDTLDIPQSERAMYSKRLSTLS